MLTRLRLTAIQLGQLDQVRDGLAVRLEGGNSVLKRRRSGKALCTLEGHRIDALDLQGIDETLDHGVVVGFAAPSSRSGHDR